MTDQYISQEKQIELVKELEELKGIRLPGLAKRIDEARQLGDLSENAEYHAAREDMAWAQTRVKDIQYILDHAQIVAHREAGNVFVGLGATIVVTVNGKERTYTLVGAQEANPAEGKISNESPLGAAFLGKKKGDTVDVTTPAGIQTYKIISLT
jgi:transcription elongation factor GreA